MFRDITMRHLKGYRKLGMNSAHRRAVLRNMATSFFENGKIRTTVPRAKELRPIVEKLLTLGRVDSLAARRRLEAYLFGNVAAKRLVETVAKRFEGRPGGYTRIVRHGFRFGDGADICQLELVDYQEQEGKILGEKKAKEKAARAKDAEEANA